MEVRHAANGRVTHTRALRLPILSDGAGDSPAIRHLSKCMGHGGYLACPHCLLRGTWANGMYFVGYNSPTAGGAQCAGCCRYTPTLNGDLVLIDRVTTHRICMGTSANICVSDLVRTVTSSLRRGRFQGRYEHGLVVCRSSSAGEGGAGQGRRRGGAAVACEPFGEVRCALLFLGLCCMCCALRSICSTGGY